MVTSNCRRCCSEVPNLGTFMVGPRGQDGDQLQADHCASPDLFPLCERSDLGALLAIAEALRDEERIRDMLAQVAASKALSLFRSRAGGSLFSSQLTWNVQLRESHWHSSLLTLRAALPMRAEPKRKKKVDPKREIAIRDRMRKKIKRLEKAPQEMIPIEDFTTPFRFMDETRVRVASPVSFEESERRALLLKSWALYKQKQHKEETKAIESLLAAQEEALKELRLESEELYQAAIRRDNGLFPFERQEPMYTPPLPNYEAPEGKCNDITKVYTQ